MYTTRVMFSIVYLFFFLKSVAPQTADFTSLNESVPLANIGIAGFRERDNNTAEVFDRKNEDILGFSAIYNETNGCLNNTADVFDRNNNDVLEVSAASNKTNECPSETWNSSIMAPVEPIFIQEDEYPPRELFMDYQRISVYPWNKLAYSPAEYHLSLCGNVCVGGHRIDFNPFNCPTIKCAPCVCDRPMCEIYDICCPEDSSPNILPEIYEQRQENMTSESSNTAKDNVQGSQSDDSDSDQIIQNPAALDKELDPSQMAIGIDMNATVKCYEEKGYSGSYLYIQSCPPGFEDVLTRNLCEKDALLGVDDITQDVFTRVTDNATGVIYHNVYCAMCNRADTIVKWEVVINCEGYQAVYSATSVDQLLTLSLRSDSRCQVDQSPAQWSNTRLVHCSYHWISSDPVSRCNETGLWPEYDEDVERACLSIEGRSLRVLHEPYEMSDGPPWWYKNVFCAICNMKSYPQHGDCSGRPPDGQQGWIEPKFRIFSFLLGFGNRGRDFAPMFESSFTFNSCLDGEWSAPDGSCMTVHCSPGKLLDLQTNSCNTALDQIRGLNYQLNLWFVPSNTSAEAASRIFSHSEFKVIADGVFEQLVEPLGGLAVQITANYAFVWQRDEGDTQDPIGPSGVKQPVAIWLSAQLETSEKFSRDWLERRLVDNFTRGSLNFNISNAHVHYQPLGLPDIQPKATAVCQRPDVMCYEDTYMTRVFDYILAAVPNNFIHPTELINCPYVSFNKSMYEIIISTPNPRSIFQEITITLTIGEVSLNFSEPSELHQVDIDKTDQSLKVCRETLDLKLREMEEKERRDFYSRVFQSQVDSSGRAQYYLTLCCVSVSLLCLVLTLATYFRFSSLRNPAGKNNMFLCGSLLLAQAALLVSAHVSGPRTLCTALGIMTHFLWLWMFVWSGICCLHMFRVFTDKTRHSLSDMAQTARFVRTIVASLTIPALIVCAVVVASHQTSGGKRIGYGHTSCYLDSSLLVGVATVLPLCIVSVTNLACFATTVGTIHQVTKLQTSTLKREGRRNLHCYIKLSTMTGAFWLVQIIAEAVELDSLRYVAIVLNGLQGTFIFFSYVWNKRVLNLYLRSFGLQPLTRTTSRTQRETTVSTVAGILSQVRRKSNRDKQKAVSLPQQNTGSDRDPDKDDLCRRRSIVSCEGSGRGSSPKSPSSLRSSRSSGFHSRRQSASGEGVISTHALKDNGGLDDESRCPSPRSEESLSDLFAGDFENKSRAVGNGGGVVKDRADGFDESVKGETDDDKGSCKDWVELGDVELI
ncbi:hypothetical protein EGW08_017804 [Elysia chlorotica]|uniref:G-protein coupled receptors family 2 profile 2 domain-containing protein n=1 Tax=Elysia chlorotica TaxID=188477 RepID=A0A433SYQ5_ELYCH|nr:hypothetical protein EGW08_017804 [Elysia chlorotica]